MKWLLLMLIFMGQAQAVTIDIFDVGANKEFYQTGDNINFYEVDANKNISTELNTKASAQALTKANADLNIIEQDALKLFSYYQPLLEQTVESLIKAISQDIKYIPAISFDDGAAVVYGTQDLEGALELYYRWQKYYEK